MKIIKNEDLRMNRLDVTILSYSDLEREYEGETAVAEGKMKIEIEDDLKIGEKLKRFTVEAICQVLLVEDEKDLTWNLASMKVDRYDFRYFDKDDTVITDEEESILINHLDSTYEEQYRQLEILVSQDVKL